MRCWLGFSILFSTTHVPYQPVTLNCYFQHISCKWLNPHALVHAVPHPYLSNLNFTYPSWPHSNSTRSQKPSRKHAAGNNVFVNSDRFVDTVYAIFQFVPTPPPPASVVHRFRIRQILSWRTFCCVAVIMDLVASLQDARCKFPLKTALVATGCS